jgi:energy-coupling factor transporter ATP-binding protein EcfA2
LLSINNVSMRFGARLLFEDVTTMFVSGRRYAISGPNGAGKSTLMRILTGDIEPSKGSVTRPKKFGVLRQDQFAFDSYRVLDTVIMGNAPLWAALQDRGALYNKPPDELTDRDGMRLGELEGTVGNEGGTLPKVTPLFCSTNRRTISISSQYSVAPAYPRRRSFRRTELRPRMFQLGLQLSYLGTTSPQTCGRWTGGSRQVPDRRYNAMGVIEDNRKRRQMSITTAVSDDLTTKPPSLPPKRNQPMFT